MSKSEVHAATTQASSIIPPDKLIPLLMDYPLPEFFTRYWIFAPIVRVTGQVGEWRQIGQTRTAHFSDGSSADETLVRFEPTGGWTNRFILKGGFSRLMKLVDDEWLFEVDAHQLTRIRWSWHMHARPGFGLLARTVLAPVVRRYLHVMLRRVLTKLDAEHVQVTYEWQGHDKTH